MTKEEKISVIYEEMADKTLDFGCLIQTQDGAYETINEVTIYTQGDYIEEYSLGDEQTRRLDIRSIIGHPVLIGNVLDWFDKGLGIFLDVNNDEGHDTYKDIIALWSDKRLPVEEQSDDAISFVFDLINR